MTIMDSAPIPARAEITIDAMNPADWPNVSSIYLEGIRTGNATFETLAPTWEQWDRMHLTVGRLVARRGRTIAGWAALTRVSQRSCYSGVAELSIYVATWARSQGVGDALMRAAIQESEAAGIWTCKVLSFRKTKRAWRSAPPTASARSDAATASANAMASGATPFSSNAAASLSVSTESPIPIAEWPIVFFYSPIKEFDFPSLPAAPILMCQLKPVQPTSVISLYTLFRHVHNVAVVRHWREERTEWLMEKPSWSSPRKTARRSSTYASPTCPGYGITSPIRWRW